MSLFVGLALVAGCHTMNDISAPLESPVSLNKPSIGDTYLSINEPTGLDDQSHLDGSVSPDQILDYQSVQYMPISLEQCVRQALSDSKVFRDLGGTVITNPLSADTTVDPALIYSNPTFGEDAALSAFDAQYSQSVIFEKNDRPFNTSFTGDTNGIFQQDLGEFNFEMTKLAATGTRYTTRGILNYDDNNQAGNRFFHSWESIVESEFRHPLMQGSGVLFNRIAGPSQTPGSFNGILIARTNTEIGLAEFQSAVREFIVNVENSYWDLYYSYRELNAQTDARDAAFEVYKNAEADADEERVSTLEKASAYEQYLRFESAVVESLEGRPTEGTQSNGGSTGGVFRRNVGVRIAERRLRYLIGMSITDGVLLQPSDQPNTTPVVFDWNESLNSAVENRPETRRQRWVLKQRELQLIAAKNYLLPRLDLVGRYRFRGLGRDLTGGEPFEAVINSPDNNNNVSGALEDLGSSNFQEWQLGVEYRTPVGRRQAHAGVRNAELGLRRERLVLKEQERKILLEISNAVAEVRRSAAAMVMAEKRFNAAVEYRAQAAERIERGRAQFDVLLEAQRRVLESQVQFINAEVEYGIAIRNVHFERGSLLNYHGVELAENESSPRAYVAANRRNSQKKKPLNYVMKNSAIAKQTQPIHAIVSHETAPSNVVPNHVVPNQTAPVEYPAVPQNYGHALPEMPASTPVAPQSGGGAVIGTFSDPGFEPAVPAVPESQVPSVPLQIEGSAMPVLEGAATQHSFSDAVVLTDSAPDQTGNPESEAAASEIEHPKTNERFVLEPIANSEPEPLAQAEPSGEPLSLAEPAGTEPAMASPNSTELVTAEQSTPAKEHPAFAQLLPIATQAVLKSGLTPPAPSVVPFLDQPIASTVPMEVRSPEVQLPEVQSPEASGVYEKLTSEIDALPFENLSDESLPVQQAAKFDAIPSEPFQLLPLVPVEPTQPVQPIQGGEKAVTERLTDETSSSVHPEFQTLVPIPASGTQN